jgi:hypothetical protein
MKPFPFPNAGDGIRVIVLEGGRMRSSLRAIVALLTASAISLPAFSFAARAGDRASEHTMDRTLPMRFDFSRQGPAAICGARCAVWISASGAITADTGRDFKFFLQSPAMQSHNWRGATVVLDSDGGSVLGAIALGREIRKAALSTTVGRIIGDSNGGKGKGHRGTGAQLSPHADCESMCAFVLLGGLRRIVPREARVMVHQIWLGDRRDDPTAATYSAEDLVLVQRDIGRLARYTAEMGGSIDLLDLALRIPPWEPLHAMTRAEIRDTQLATDEAIDTAPAIVAVAPKALPPQAQPVTNGARAAPINERRWAMVEQAGVTTLARRHPLTVAGDTIGSFDLVLACGTDPDSFDLSYVERRHGTGGTPLVARLTGVSLRAGPSQAVLKIAASAHRDHPDELVSLATGAVPAAIIRAFADAGSHSMVIETRGTRRLSDEGADKDGGMVTVIRLGNTGTQKNLPRLVASCAKPFGDRAEAATLRKTGGMAVTR